MANRQASRMQVAMASPRHRQLSFMPFGLTVRRKRSRSPVDCLFGAGAKPRARMSSAADVSFAASCHDREAHRRRLHASRDSGREGQTWGNAQQRVATDGLQFATGVFQADVSSPEAVDERFAHALEVMGGVDILVNDAGIAGPTASIVDVSVDDWDQTMAVNLRSQFLCLRRAVPVLRRSDRASVINMSSVAGHLAYPLRTPCAASKWVVVGLTQGLAVELGDDDITVNAILPGIVDSERARSVTATKARACQISEEAMRSEILANVALHRIVPMDDVAEMALFLASRAGRSVTGQCLNVCAGIQSLG